MASGDKRAFTLAPFVSHGVLAPGRSVLSCSVGGMEYFADLGPLGEIKFEGKVFKSPSAFSVYVKRKNNPGRKADDGWTSVKYNGEILAIFRSKLDDIQTEGGSILKDESGGPIVRPKRKGRAHRLHDNLSDEDPSQSRQSLEEDDDEWMSNMTNSSKKRAHFAVANTSKLDNINWDAANSNGSGEQQHKASPNVTSNKSCVHKIRSSADAVMSHDGGDDCVWVQCASEACRKWRRVAHQDAGQEPWFCDYGRNPKYFSCGAPEEGATSDEAPQMRRAAPSVGDNNNTAPRARAVSRPRELSRGAAEATAAEAAEEASVLEGGPVFLRALQEFHEASGHRALAEVVGDTRVRCGERLLNLHELYVMVKRVGGLAQCDADLLRHSQTAGTRATAAAGIDLSTELADLPLGGSESANRSLRMTHEALSLFRKYLAAFDVFLKRECGGLHLSHQSHFQNRGHLQKRNQDQDLLGNSPVTSPSQSMGGNTKCMSPQHLQLYDETGHHFGSGITTVVRKGSRLPPGRPAVSSSADIAYALIKPEEGVVHEETEAATGIDSGLPGLGFRSGLGSGGRSATPRIGQVVGSLSVEGRNAGGACRVSAADTLDRQPASVPRTQVESNSSMKRGEDVDDGVADDDDDNDDEDYCGDANASPELPVARTGSSTTPQMGATDFESGWQHPVRTLCEKSASGVGSSNNGSSDVLAAKSGDAEKDQIKSKVNNCVIVAPGSGNVDSSLGAGPAISAASELRTSGGAPDYSATRACRREGHEVAGLHGGIIGDVFMTKDEGPSRAPIAGGRSHHLHRLQGPNGGEGGHSGGTGETGGMGGRQRLSSSGGDSGWIPAQPDGERNSVGTRCQVVAVASGGAMDVLTIFGTDRRPAKRSISYGKVAPIGLPPLDEGRLASRPTSWSRDSPGTPPLPTLDASVHFSPTEWGVKMASGTAGVANVFGGSDGPGQSKGAEPRRRLTNLAASSPPVEAASSCVTSSARSPCRTSSISPENSPSPHTWARTEAVVHASSSSQTYREPEECKSVLPLRHSPNALSFLADLAGSWEDSAGTQAAMPATGNKLLSCLSATEAESGSAGHGIGSELPHGHSTTGAGGRRIGCDTEEPLRDFVSGKGLDAAGLDPAFLELSGKVDPINYIVQPQLRALGPHLYFPRAASSSLGARITKSAHQSVVAPIPPTVAIPTATASNSADPNNFSAFVSSTRPQGRTTRDLPLNHDHLTENSRLHFQGGEVAQLLWLSGDRSTTVSHDPDHNTPGSDPAAVSASRGETGSRCSIYAPLPRRPPSADPANPVVDRLLDSDLSIAQEELGHDPPRPASGLSGDSSSRKFYHVVPSSLSRRASSDSRPVLTGMSDTNNHVSPELNLDAAAMRHQMPSFRDIVSLCGDPPGVVDSAHLQEPCESIAAEEAGVAAAAAPFFVPSQLLGGASMAMMEAEALAGLRRVLKGLGASPGRTTLAGRSGMGTPEPAGVKDTAGPTAVHDALDEHSEGAERGTWNGPRHSAPLGLLTGAAGLIGHQTTGHDISSGLSRRPSLPVPFVKMMPSDYAFDGDRDRGSICSSDVLGGGASVQSRPVIATSASAAGDRTVLSTSLPLHLARRFEQACPAVRIPAAMDTGTVSDCKESRDEAPPPPRLSPGSLVLVRGSVGAYGRAFPSSFLVRESAPGPPPTRCPVATADSSADLSLLWPAVVAHPQDVPPQVTRWLGARHPGGAVEWSSRGDGCGCDIDIFSTAGHEHFPPCLHQNILGDPAALAWIKHLESVPLDPEFSPDTVPVLFLGTSRLEWVSVSECSAATPASLVCAQRELWTSACEPLPNISTTTCPSPADTPAARPCDNAGSISLPGDPSDSSYRMMRPLSFCFAQRLRGFKVALELCATAALETPSAGTLGGFPSVLHSHHDASVSSVTTAAADAPDGVPLDGQGSAGTKTGHDDDAVRWRNFQAAMTPPHEDPEEALRQGGLTPAVGMLSADDFGATIPSRAYPCDATGCSPLSAPSPLPYNQVDVHTSTATAIATCDLSLAGGIAKEVIEVYGGPLDHSDLEPPNDTGRPVQNIEGDAGFTDECADESEVLGDSDMDSMPSFRDARFASLDSFAFCPLPPAYRPSGLRPSSLSSHPFDDHSLDEEMEAGVPATVPVAMSSGEGGILATTSPAGSACPSVWVPELVTSLECPSGSGRQAKRPRDETTVLDTYFPASLEKTMEATCYSLSERSALGAQEHEAIVKPCDGSRNPVEKKEATDVSPSLTVRPGDAMAAGATRTGVSGCRRSESLPRGAGALTLPVGAAAFADVPTKTSVGATARHLVQAASLSLLIPQLLHLEAVLPPRPIALRPGERPSPTTHPGRDDTIGTGIGPWPGGPSHPSLDARHARSLYSSSEHENRPEDAAGAAGTRAPSGFTAVRPSRSGVENPVDGRRSGDAGGSGVSNDEMESWIQYWSDWRRDVEASKSTATLANQVFVLARHLKRRRLLKAELEDSVWIHVSDLVGQPCVSARLGGAVLLLAASLDWEALRRAWGA